MTGRNRTIRLTDGERGILAQELLPIPEKKLVADEIRNKIFHGDCAALAAALPPRSADLLFLDPPYGIAKKFGSLSFPKISDARYSEYLQSWFPALVPLLKPGASVYFCTDWHTSNAVASILQNCGFEIRNRITWQREKGRSSATNWKNCHEDIWYAVKPGAEPYFDPDAVKIRRKVIAPYRNDGIPKDWKEDESGCKSRLTGASNFWDDLTVPFWSMPENTEHPTQKPEKLVARIILASSRPGDLILDPFMGSGTTAATAVKLGRCFTGCEINEEYVMLAMKRVAMAQKDRRIQGYCDGVFLERNFRLADQ